MSADMVILVSACLAGERCAYDGLPRKNKKVIEFCKGKKVIAVCPEMMGGLASPRERHEICGGDGTLVLSGGARVLSFSGEDNTERFISGAELTLKKAREYGCHLAILKEFSPSCGVSQIYDGNFDEKTVMGRGVTAAILENSGIRVVSEVNFNFQSL